MSAAIVAVVIGVDRWVPCLVLISLLGAAMGAQNAIARRIAVPDLTTTVLTLTVTGLVADAHRPRYASVAPCPSSPCSPAPSQAAH